MDANIIWELCRPKPHKGMLNWIGGVPADRLSLSAVAVCEIQADIGIMLERDTANAEELTSRLDRGVASYGVQPMDLPAFREWACLKHGKSDALIEDAMIATAAKVRRLTVAARKVCDFRVFGVDILDPFDRE